MDYTVIDLEMTGLAVKHDKVIEIGAARVRNGVITDVFGTLVHARIPIPPEITALTGITDAMAATGMEEDDAMHCLLDFMGADVLVGHNVSFDYRFVKQWAVNARIGLACSACDTLRIARALLPPEQSKKLEDLCDYFHIERKRAHRAVDDAVETARVFEALHALPGAKEELFEPKQLEYRVKRQTPATAHQIKRLRELIEGCGYPEEIRWESLTRSEASRLYDKIRTRKAPAFPK